MVLTHQTQWEAAEGALFKHEAFRGIDGSPAADITWARFANALQRHFLRCVCVCALVCLRSVWVVVFKRESFHVSQHSMCLCVCLCNFSSLAIYNFFSFRVTQGARPLSKSDLQYLHSRFGAYYNS